MILLAAAHLIAEDLRYYEPEIVYREEGSKYYRYAEKSIAEKEARPATEYISHIWRG